MNLFQIPESKLLSVTLSTSAHETANPEYSIAHSHCDQKHQPEPNQHKNNLIEQIYTQHTLYYVRMNGANLTNVNFAQSYTREYCQMWPLILEQKRLDQIDSKQIELVADQAVQEVKLSDQTSQVQELYNHIQQ